MSLKISGRPLIIAATTGALMLGMGGYAYREEHRSRNLEVYVFSMKSGRSMFIRTPDDRRFLIDGGANSDIVRELSKILPFYSHHLDAVIATNSEGKNISGLIDVINRYRVEKVYVPKFTIQSIGLASSSDLIYETFEETIKSLNIAVEEVMVGDSIDLRDANNNINYNTTNDSSSRSIDLVFDFPLSPDEFEYSKASPPETLFHIIYGDTSIVFLGNASNKVQKSLTISMLSADRTMNTKVQSKENALIVSHSALPANTSSDLMAVLMPKNLVYSKSLTTDTKSNSKSSSKSIVKKSSSKKPIPDPLATILNDHRFNLKEVGTIKISSDSKQLEIKPL
ncbi:MAG: hypothetical protein WC648_02210 [Candidatus Paceibacterota bacterium]|jgi:hypothetical protein